MKEDLYYQALNGRASIYILIGENEKAKRDIKEGIKFSRKKRDKIKEIEFYRLLAEVYFNKGKYSRTAKILEKILETLKKSGDHRGLSETLYFMGLINSVQGNYVKALKFLKKALEIERKKGMKDREAYSLSSIGALYYRKGKLNLSLYYFKKALKIFETTKDPFGEAGVLGNIGAILNIQDRYREALHYLHMSLNIKRKIQDVTGTVFTINNIGFAYIRQGEYKKALSYLKEALKISKKAELYYPRILVLHNIFDVYIETENFKMAKKILDELEIYQKNNTLDTVRRICIAYGEFSLICKNIKEKRKYVKRFKSLAKKIKEKKGDIYLLTGRTNFSMGEFHRAEENFKKAIILFRKEKSRYKLAKTYFFYSELLLHLKHSRRAELYLKKAEEIFKGIHNKAYIKKIKKLQSYLNL